jgi:hypothetical protein
MSRLLKATFTYRDPIRCWLTAAPPDEVLCAGRRRGPEDRIRYPMGGASAKEALAAGLLRWARAG